MRRLFKQADDEIERSVDTRVATIDARQLKLLLSDAVVFFDTISHDLIQVNPQVRNDAIDRAAPGGTLVSAFVAHKLVLKRKADLVSVLRESFLSLLKNPGTASCAGILFEQMAHQYIFNGRASPYRLTSLAKPTQELSVNLSHVNKVEYFDKFVSSDFIPSFYYRPVSSNLPGIGSFAFEVNDQGRIIGMVAFQSTVSSSHPIDVKFFEQIWGLTSIFFEVVKFVFVIPKENHIGLQSIKSASDRQKWTPRIQQYVLEIDANKIWD